MYCAALDIHINNRIAREQAANPHLDPVSRKLELLAEYGITDLRFINPVPGGADVSQSLPHSSKAKKKKKEDHRETKSVGSSTLSLRRKPFSKSPNPSATIDRERSRQHYDVVGERLGGSSYNSLDRRSPSCYRWPLKAVTPGDEDGLMTSIQNHEDVSATTTLNRTTTTTASKTKWKVWKCGVSLDSWVKCIAVIDIVKGTFGLILSAYLAVSIFRLMARTPDFQDLKRRMGRTEFVYIFAYGATGWGVVLSVCGMAFWNFLLICFGIFLFYAVVERSLLKLRFWYVYAILSLLVFAALYIRLWIASIECRDSYLCQADHNDWVWTIAQVLYFVSFGPTIYSITLVSELCDEIPLFRREQQYMLSRSLSRIESSTM